MGEYRKFWLENSQGNKFELTNLDYKHFLGSPRGLGFSKEIEGFTLGNVTKVTNVSYDFMTITGSVLFYDNLSHAYQDYFEFIKFLSYNPLKLYYLPPNTLKPYYCDCQVAQVDKEEYSTKGYLSIPISILMLSHWQDAEETIIEAENTLLGQGKFYDLERPYFYGATLLNDITLMNTGNDEVGFIVEVLGSVVNPQWTISQNGEVVGSCKINGNFDKVIVNSRDGEQEIYLENGGSIIANPSSYQDLSISGGILTFCRLKTGTSKMNFTSGNVFTGKVRIHLKNSYVSV